MPDLALDLLRHGYDALPRHRARVADPDAYAARLLGRRALVVRGEDGARFFYDTSRLVRHQAAPGPLADLLFGPGAVHGLDGDEHRRRKDLFLGILTVDAVSALQDQVVSGLTASVESWPERGRVRLFDELVAVYGEAVLGWAAGCTYPEAEHVSRDLAAIVAGFGFRPMAYARARGARRRADAWARGLLEDARAGVRQPRPGSAADVFARGAGAGLPLEVAAVELVNVVRPTVAVAWLGTFAALALANNPQHGERLLTDLAFRVAFAHEVRRQAPFVPALAARAAVSTHHRGHAVRPGQRVVLDVPGTNLDPEGWTDPGSFRPERFLREGPTHDGLAYRFVPQGGGRKETGHRCPGEDLTTALLTVTLEVLAATAYTVVDGRTERRHIPALPRHGLELTDVRVCARAGTDAPR